MNFSISLHQATIRVDATAGLRGASVQISTAGLDALTSMATLNLSSDEARALVPELLRAADEAEQLQAAQVGEAA